MIIFEIHNLPNLIDNIFIIIGFVFLLVAYSYKLHNSSIKITYSNNKGKGSIINKKELISINIYNFVLFITLIIIFIEVVINFFNSDNSLICKTLYYHMINIVSIVIVLLIINQIVLKLKYTRSKQDQLKDLIGNVNLFIIAYICSSLSHVYNSIPRDILGYGCILLSLYRIYYFRVINKGIQSKSLNIAIVNTMKSFSYFILSFLFACNFSMEIANYGIHDKIETSFLISRSSGNYFLDMFVYCLSTCTTVGNAGVYPVSTTARLLNVILILIGPITIGIFVNEMSKLKNNPLKNI